MSVAISPKFSRKFSRFSLNHSKGVISPQLTQFATRSKAYRNLIADITTYIDKLLEESDLGCLKDYFPRKQGEVLSCLLSFLAHEGYSHFNLDTLANKAGVKSRKTVSTVISKLSSIGVIQIVNIGRDSQQQYQAGLYVLTAHPNFKNIADLFKTVYGIAVSIVEKYTRIYTRFYSRFYSRHTSENPCDSKAAEQKNDSNIFNSTNLPKKENTLKDISVIDPFNDDELNKEKEAYCQAAGIPEKVVQVLKGGLSLSEIMNIWSSLSRTLKKYEKSYDKYEDMIVRIIRKVVLLYKTKRRTNPSIDFNFAGCICGFLKDQFKTSNVDHKATKQSPSPTLQEDMAHNLNAVPNHSSREHSKQSRKPVIPVIQASVGNNTPISAEEMEQVMKLAESLMNR